MSLVTELCSLKTRSIYTFSIAASSGITTWHLHPQAGATIARLIAVLLALPSVTTPPRVSFPDSKACKEPQTNTNDQQTQYANVNFQNSNQGIDITSCLLIQRGFIHIQHHSIIDKAKYHLNQLRQHKNNHTNNNLRFLRLPILQNSYQSYYNLCFDDLVKFSFFKTQTFKFLCFSL